MSHVRTSIEPRFSDDEAAALRLILGLAIGRDRVSAETKKFLDGNPSKLPDSLKAKLTKAAEVIHESVTSATYTIRSRVDKSTARPTARAAEGAPLMTYRRHLLPKARQINAVQLTRVCCAWCNAEQRSDGTYGEPRPTLDRSPGTSHGICGPCITRTLSHVPRPRMPEVVWCGTPELDMGLCLACNRTTVDHLIDRDNIAAVNTLRAHSTEPLSFGSVYRSRVAA